MRRLFNQELGIQTYKYHDAVLQLKEAINPIGPDHGDFKN